MFASMTATRQKERPKLQASIRKLIKIVKAFEPGERLPSDRTLGMAMGVSNITASLAMQEIERRGLVRRKSRSGSYRVDPRESGHVAIYCELDVFHPAASRFYGLLIQELRLGLAEKNIRSVPYIGRTPPYELAQKVTAPWFLEDIDIHRIIASIVLATARAPWGEKAGMGSIPSIGLDAKCAVTVNWDYNEFVREGVRVLAARGCRKIALMMWGNELLPSFHWEMAKAGLPVHEKWVRGEIPPSRSGAGWEEIRSIWSAPGKEKPDGLLVGDDCLFRDAMLTFAELGIHPGKNVQIVTHMNKGLEPPGNYRIIRAVADPAEIAAIMIRHLLGWFDQGPPADKVNQLLPLKWYFPEV
jgi:DNA-binding LacI/PurR family transcriptional regulator